MLMRFSWLVFGGSLPLALRWSLLGSLCQQAAVCALLRFAAVVAAAVRAVGSFRALFLH
jgi:hypothetical protein